MTHLDLPRIHFTGKFTTGPSTINNTTSNYDITRPLGRQLWNPQGTAYFQLFDCRIQSVVDGATADALTDTLVGQELVSTDDWGGGGVPAKIVDLDPQQQMVSMLYGLQLRIGEGDNSLTADFQPVWFQDYIGVGAAYQSVLVRPKWGNQITSKGLRALQQNSPKRLSIKFVLDNPSFPGPPPSRCHGRIVGTIGPAETGKPINFVEGRLLRPVGNFENLNFGPAILRGRRLTIDLLNAIPFSGSSPPNLGLLEVSVTVPKGPTYSLGAFDYTAGARQTHALIQDFDLSGLSETDLEDIHNAPISVGQGPSAAIFQEDKTGLYVDATPYVFRMEANAQAKVRFWAGRFGAAEKDVEVVVTDASKLLPTRPPPRVGSPGMGGTPLTFTPATVKTNSKGVATITIDGGNPANSRRYMDGQVYALSFHPNPEVSHPDPNTFLSFLVHDEFDVQPTWANIRPIMQQYARLYPFMDFVPLTDPKSIRDGGWIPKLLQVFSYRIEDPRYMPVVRDLSAAKQKAIVAWLNAGAPGSAARKTARKKATAKRAARKKASPRKTTGKKAAARKKSDTKKVAKKKSTGRKKSAGKKSPRKKAPGRKKARGRS